MGFISLLSFKISFRIHTEENEEQQSESPQRGTAIGEEGERNTDDRSQAQHHSHIDEQVEKEDAEHTIPIDSSHRVRLSFSKCDESPNEEQIDNEHACRTDESFFFAHCAEDKVRVLLWHIS